MFNVNSSRKNGDESSKEAAKVAAAAVPVGICAAVSHAAGLEASPTSGPPAAPQTQMGSAAPRPGAARDDLDGGRFRVRAVRGGTRVLRALLRKPQTSGQDVDRLSKSPGTHSGAPVVGSGPGRPGSDSTELCRAAAH